jgi:hypothetical protein
MWFGGWAWSRNFVIMMIVRYQLRWCLRAEPDFVARTDVVWRLYWFLRFNIFVDVFLICVIQCMCFIVFLSALLAVYVLRLFCPIFFFNQSTMYFFISNLFFSDRVLRSLILYHIKLMREWEKKKIFFKSSYFLSIVVEKKVFLFDCHTL